MDVWLERIMTREAFGKKLSQFDSMMQEIALSRLEIDQARLLTLKAAHSMDVLGNQLARDQIAAIKIVAPRMVCKVIDRAIQAHGIPFRPHSLDPPPSQSLTHEKLIFFLSDPRLLHVLKDPILGRRR